MRLTISLFMVCMLLNVALCDNWAVLVNTSRYWFNYRHSSNILAMYDFLRAQGWDDAHIVLMDSGQIPSNPRHPRSPAMLSHPSAAPVDLAGMVVGFQDQDVTASAFRKLLLGLSGSTASTRRFEPDADSSVIVYITGHGGEQFIKFHDQHEMLAPDFASTFEDMIAMGRAKRVLFLSDTCKSGTLFDNLVGESQDSFHTRDGVELPSSGEASFDVVGIASAHTGEDSYAAFMDTSVGEALIDRFTYSLLHYLKGNLACSSGAMGGSLSELSTSGALSKDRLLSTARLVSTTRAGTSRPLGEYFCPNIAWQTVDA
ncbi:Peptidase C13, legumain [Carpediemonas membranifera]|uniref:Peptidase C13, legumain n=1 Tax=Carpediemonas membranifera TaxID=201153 RepID=A0A8J6ATH5_9EUKA|nr:Peptidase C13, legumain [Carpediemonas membranifera]|eukprot:KAG9393703.1 Peptidase C13, legumain [Carpediemonas membranifera]